MIYFRTSRLFQLRGIARPFAYLTRLGYSNGYATKLANDKIYRINLDRLEALCRQFNCTPNDILDFQPSANDTIPADHALHAITKPPLNNIMAKINGLPPEKIQQIHEMIKNME